LLFHEQEPLKEGMMQEDLRGKPLPRPRSASSRKPLSHLRERERSPPKRPRFAWLLIVPDWGREERGRPNRAGGHLSKGGVSATAVGESGRRWLGTKSRPWI